jgi:ribonuclease HI
METNSNKLSASEALFGFMGWLTSLETPVTFSSRHYAGTAAELVDEFCKANNLDQPRNGWSENFVYPTSRSTVIAPVTETDKTTPGMKIVSVYADGGVIGSNPSAIGGTYAYRLIEEDGEVGHYIDGAFVLTARENGGTVTNNQTEMMGVLSALELVPDDFAGTVYSDSQVTLGRVFMGWKWANVPKFMHEKYQALRARLINFNNIKYVLLDGHPTKAQLQAGKGKRGQPVSEHNVWCDHACTEAGEKYLADYEQMNPLSLAEV